MKTILTAFLCALFFTFPALAGQPAQPAQQSAAASAQPTPDVSTELKLQQQKIDFFKERLDLQDKRIGDLGMFLGSAIALLGILITGIVVFFSFKSTREAVLAAKDEARKEIEAQANKVIGDWIGRNGKQRLKELLKPEIEDAIQKIHESASSVIEKLAQETQNAHEHNQRQEQLIAEYTQKLGRLTPEEEKTVNEMAAQLDAKAPKDYRFSDWLMLGIKAFQENKFEIAEENFGKAVAAAENPTDGASALYNKGVTLDQMGKNDEAIAVYDEVVKRYGDAPEAGPCEQVANALNGRGFARLREAKKRWQAGDESAAGELLKLAREDIESALTRKPDLPGALGNRGYILFLQGHAAEAEADLAQALRLGGEELRQAELADADIHSLPKDQAFKKLINSLPCA